MIKKEILKEIKSKLVKTFEPVEIYLFGSYAWGKPDKDSDIDLLVVVEKMDQKQWEAQALGYKVLFNIDLPKDIVVFPKSEFDARAKKVSSLFYKIKKNGIKIYARA